MAAPCRGMLAADGERRPSKLARGAGHRLLQLVSRDQTTVAATVAVDRIVVDEVVAGQPDEDDVVIPAVERLRSTGQQAELHLRDDDALLSKLLADLVERPAVERLGLVAQAERLGATHLG